MSAGSTGAAARAARALNGRWTVQSPTGEHRTFRIATQPDDAAFAPGQRIVSLLSNGDNVDGYRSFAFIDERCITVFRKSRGLPGQPSFHEQVALMLWSLLTDPASPWLTRGCKLLGEATCLRCNRVLTEPESIAIGIGPTCLEKV